MMSGPQDAKPPAATKKRSKKTEGRLVPITPRQNGRLFDHFVGAGEQTVGHVDA
jgi:hypothetical protein